MRIILLLGLAACLHAKNPIKNYKISMVSSEESNKPALFTHGESPVWDVDTQSLFFVDVHQQNVHRLDYATGKIYTKHIGYGQVNVVSLVSGSRRLLVCVRAGLYLLDWDVAGDSALRLITTVDDGLPDNYLNEGKPDVEGRFWAGTKGPQSGDEVTPDKGTFYSFDLNNFKPQVQLRPVSISNGLVWSLNNTVLYYIDSSTQKVEAFDFDSVSGAISGRRTIVDITNYGYEDAIPDGMTIDKRGNLWVAIMFGGTVLHVNPDKREVIFGYKLPVSRTTSLTWGGPNLDELFVTTSKETDSEDRLSGAIFTIRETGSAGLPPNKLKMENADDY
ncbi:regucalcin isoform 1 [Danaus plexippus plexippus]|uniref:Regucalcin isoform 1 n=1 Tax=Danaus plexippus plexippus TaxID=278856 RepID=A0A212EYC9_DANPL|nr:regucalcin isoform 1 [Danaus plexippus plexippus]